MARLSIAEALREGLRQEMIRDGRVFCLGEDIGVRGGWGGAFTVTLGLENDFRSRIIDTPISEAGISSFWAARSATPGQVCFKFRIPIFRWKNSPHPVRSTLILIFNRKRANPLSSASTRESTAQERLPTPK